MQKHIFTFLFLVTQVFNVFSQNTEQSSVEKNLRKTVSYLASDQLEGRRTGKKGGTVAAGYIANMFAHYKLKAGIIQISDGKTQKNFLQAFPYLADVELGKTSLLRITNTKKLLSPRSKSNWAPLGYSPNADLPYTKVVFAGFGIKSEKLNYDDYAKLEIKDKIVLAFDGVPDNDNPHNLFFLFNAHAKAKIAKEKGAKALILISREENFADDRLALRFNQTLGETAIPTIMISRQIAAKLLETDESGFVMEEQLLNAKAKGGTSAESLISRGQTLLASLKINLIKKRVEVYNVIGVLEGRDFKLKKEVIVIGAHYDHLGRGGSGSLALDSKEVHHGADDNASGTSALLELARRFSEDRTNKRTIVFIAFGGEEQGLLGSNFFVNNPIVPRSDIITMINMDMVGRLKNGKLTIGGIGTASEWKKLVTEKQPYISGSSENAAKDNSDSPTSPVTNGKVLAANFGGKKVFNLQLNQDGFGPSDHSSFYSKKIPVLFFFTGTHVDYHKPSDTAEKINYKGLEKVTNFVSEIIKAVDQNPKRPTYRIARGSSVRNSRRGFSVSLGTIPSYADSNSDGLTLDGVREDSPASKSGIKSGDKIIKLAGKEIRNISDYVFVLGEMKAGEIYDVVVVRGKEKLELKIVPKKR